MGRGSHCTSGTTTRVQRSVKARAVRLPHTMNVRMITGVVLAAGASTRMGQHKLLLPLVDEPLVRRTVRQVLDAGFDDVLVVVGFEGDAVIAALEGLSARHAINP